MNKEWSFKVNRYARVLLDERHFNKAKTLPIPGDIVELASFLVEKIKTTDLSKPNAETFRDVVILTEARLLMYNKRRKTLFISSGFFLFVFFGTDSKKSILFYILDLDLPAFTVDLTA